MMGAEYDYWAALIKESIRKKNAEAAAARVGQRQVRQNAFDQIIMELEQAEAVFKIFNMDWKTAGRSAAVTHYYQKGHLEKAKLQVRRLKRQYT